jgi:hypothetical protein
LNFGTGSPPVEGFLWRDRVLSHAKGNAPSTIRFPTVNNGAGRGLSSETEGQTADCRAFSWLAGGDKTAGNG